MKTIFKIRKEERLFALVSMTVFILFNGLLIYSRFDRFTIGAHGGFWTIFYNHLNMSGYDVFSCIAVSCLRVHYSTLRHPLYIALLLPLYWLNSWLMEVTGFNFAVFFIAALNVFCATYASVFMLRILNGLAGVSRRDAMLLTAMLYGFAHVLIATMVPDHFGISMFLLVATIYIAGTRMKERKPMSPLLAGTLFFLSAGMTLSNGVKTGLALLFTNGRKAFSWRYVTAFAVPLLLFAGLFYWQQQAIIKPQSENIKKIEDHLKQKNPNFGDKFKAHDEWVRKQNGKAMTEDIPLLEWSDITTPRMRSITENLFGESLQLHRSHLLEDVQQTRPVFVSYRWAASYVVEALIVLLFAAGIWYGRRSRLLRLVLSWFAFDMTMHIVFGFGINEVYIMTAHWAFVIPIAAAYVLRNAGTRTSRFARALTLLLTIWLWGYNGWLITGYLV